MFDIGISEIAVIAVVALVVIGPERLPKVARTVGTLLGRAQRYVNDVKAEVNREMELEELKKLQTQMQDAARGIQEQVSTAGAEMQSAMHDVEKQLHEGATPAAGTPTLPAEAAPQAAGDSGLTTPLTEPPPEVAPLAADIPAPEPPLQASANTIPATSLSAPPAAAVPPSAAAAAPEPSPPSAAPERQPPAAAVPPSAVHAAPEPSPPADRPVQASLFPEHTIR